VLPDWKNDQHKEQGWSIELPPTWPPFNSCVTAVYGSETLEVRQIAAKLGRSTLNGVHLMGSDVFLDLTTTDPIIDISDMIPGELHKVPCGNPYLCGDELLSLALATIENLMARKQFVRRVLVGDLQSLRSFWSAEGIRHSLGVLLAILRQVGIPAILFETAVPRTILVEPGLGDGYKAFPVQQPRIVDFADVVIEIQSMAQGEQKEMIASCARRGLQELLQA
jgi:hypothetical protein